MSNIGDKKVYIIAAVDSDGGIGKEGKLPWHFKKEMQYFKDTTSETFEFDNQNMVIMGRNTWESLPKNYRPLEGRSNVVISRDKKYKADGAAVCFSLGEALKKAELDDTIENVFIIGGAQIYDLSIEVADGLYLTRIEHSYDCDTFFPEFAHLYEAKPEDMGSETEDGVDYHFYYYNRFPDDLVL